MIAGLIAAIRFGVVEVQIEFLYFFVFLAMFLVSYFVSHAYAVRISRALEVRGYLLGRGTILLWAGPLAILNLVVVFVVCAAFGMQITDPSSPGALDEVIGGALMVPCAFGTGALALAGVGSLPQRRRAGPHRRLNPTIGFLAGVLARAAMPLMFAIFGGAMLIGLWGDPPSGWGWAGIIFLVVPMVILVSIIFGTWIGASMTGYAARLRRPSAPVERTGPYTLYLRPFEEEHRLFAPASTLEEFLSAEIEGRVGPLVALGNPLDRIAPAGAERRYHGDEDWQAALEELASSATCIVGVTSASASTTWELTRIHELGLEQRLFLVSPPEAASDLSRSSEASPSWLRTRLAFVRDVFDAYMEDDTARISRLMSFGKLPAAWSTAGVTAWTDFVSELIQTGYTVSTEDPGPGSVIGFNQGGSAIVLARGSRTASDYVDPIVARLA